MILNWTVTQTLKKPLFCNKTVTKCRHQNIPALLQETCGDESSEICPNVPKVVHTTHITVNERNLATDKRDEFWQQWDSQVCGCRRKQIMLLWQSLQEKNGRVGCWLLGNAKQDEKFLQGGKWCCVCINLSLNYWLLSGNYICCSSFNLSEDVCLACLWVPGLCLLIHLTLLMMGGVTSI